MPWDTPSALTVRTNNADYIQGKTQRSILPNSDVAALSDANAGNASQNLLYLDWQSKQYLPDTAEDQFLDRWGNIFLKNADGSWGRKLASYASGTVTVTATAPGTLPQGAQLTYGSVLYATTSAVTLGVGANPVPVRALDAGAVGNLVAGTALSISVAVSGVSGSTPIAVISMTGGADEESDDELRARVLARIRQPPMGGCADDYVAWALSIPAVTRAWCSPKEQGPGTVTVRFMMDDLRATTVPSTNGFPLPSDVVTVQAYLDLVRPVCADVFAASPIATPVNATIRNLAGDSPVLRAAINAGVDAMLLGKAAPASQFNGVAIPATNIPAAWMNDAVFQAVGGVYFDLVMPDAVMPNGGCLAVRGTIS